VSLTWHAERCVTIIVEVEGTGTTKAVIPLHAQFLALTWAVYLSASISSTPTGINAKPVEVLVVHVSAALIDVACQVKQPPPASQSLTAFNCSRYKTQVPVAYIYN
jgi:hypothetical protein